jgi:hypothetical protein
MAFLLDTFARSVFKRMVGKSHTSDTRDPANEPIASGFTLAAQNIWAAKINPTPGDSSNAGLVSDLLTLTLEPVSGTANTGKYAAYRTKLGASVPASLVGKINRITGVAYAANDYVGDIIPQNFGDGFRPKLFKGATETPPMDASDWFLDASAGVITQEEDNTGAMIDYSTTGTVQAYVYTGAFVSDVLVSESVTFVTNQTIGSGITGTVNGSNRVFTLDYTPVAGSLVLALNGLITEDYSLVGAVITMGTGSIPQTDAGYTDKLVANYRR